MATITNGYHSPSSGITCKPIDKSLTSSEPLTLETASSLISCFPEHKELYDIANELLCKKQVDSQLKSCTNFFKDVQKLNSDVFKETTTDEKIKILFLHYREYLVTELQQLKRCKEQSDIMVNRLVQAYTDSSTQAQALKAIAQFIRTHIHIFHTRFFCKAISSVVNKEYSSIRDVVENIKSHEINSSNLKQPTYSPIQLD